MAVNWNIGAGNNALANFQFGVGLGQNLQDRRDAREHKNALLAQNQQEIDLKAAEAKRKQDQDSLLTGLRQRALAGDQTAMQELAARDPAQFKAYEEQGRTALAEAAFDIVQTADPAARAAKWDAYAQRFNRPDLVGQYSDQRLNEVVSQGGLQQEFQRFQQPDYVPVGEGGLAGFQFGQPIQQGGQPQNFGNVPPPPAGFQLDEGGPGAPPPGAGFR